MLSTPADRFLAAQTLLALAGPGADTTVSPFIRQPWPVSMRAVNDYLGILTGSKLAIYQLFLSPSY